MVVTQHSVISDDARFDAADVRNVEVTVRDNDTPGVYVTEVAPGTTTEDRRTLVIEGDSTTQLTDEVLVQLAKAPEVGDAIVVKLNLDADSDQQISLLNPTGDTRFDLDARTITFDSTNWDDPVRVGIQARDDFRREDPRHRGDLVRARRLDRRCERRLRVPEPALRHGAARRRGDRQRDRRRGGAAERRRHAQSCARAEPPTTTISLRLTKQPTADVDVAIVTDGLADVVSVDGTALTPADYQEIGGLRPTQIFLGSIVFEDVGGVGTLTRGTGADLGSFIDEGFAAAQQIRIGGTALHDGDYYVSSVTHGTITLTTALGAAGPVEVQDTVALSRLAREGYLSRATSSSRSESILIPATRSTVSPAAWRSTSLAGSRTASSRVSGSASTDGAERRRIRFKIAIIRGDNDSKDDTIELTLERPARQRRH